MEHIPVLLKEVLYGLDPQEGDNFIDCTLGDGGHTRAILEKVGGSGKVLAIDADQNNIDLFKKRFPKLLQNVILAHGNFEDLGEIVKQHDFENVQGILFDLGWSSRQFSESGRGFSFMVDEPLDMRLNSTEGLTATELLNQTSKEELGRIFREYGEEKKWRELAQAFTDRRKRQEFKTTFDVVKTVETVIKRHGALHPATLIFQALRIAVNHELESLQKTLPEAYKILKPGGRVAVISFHSLEDRIVKRFFQQQTGASLITKKPIIATRAEILKNPRARSAKLRIIQK